MLETVALIASTAGNLFLSLLVITKNRRNISYWFFSALTLSLAIWPVVNYLSIHSHTNQLLYIRIVMLFVCFMNLSFFCLAAAFPRQRVRFQPWQVGVIIYGLAAALLMLTPYVFTGVVIGPDGLPSPTPGPGIIFFMLDLVGVAGSGFYLLVRHRRRVQGLERSQLGVIIFASAFLYIFSVSFNFIVPIGLHVVSAVSFGPIFTVFFAGCMAYAIVRQRLFDIRRVVARSVSYILLLIFLAVVYAVGAQALGRLLLGNLAQESQDTMVFNAILAIILALTFQPLRHFFEYITDSIFYRNRYVSQVVLSEFSSILVRENDLGTLVKSSLKTICGGLSISHGQLYILDKGRVYLVEHYGALPKRMIVAPQLEHLSKSIIVADELDGGETKTLLEDHDLRFSAMLRTRDEVVGYLLLGDKLSGEIYSNQDIEVLGIMAKELAVAISNAKAYTEIQAFAQTLQERVNHATGRLRVANRHLKELDQAKDEFLSLASHQLRTPLTTIKGYLSMIIEGDAGKLNKLQREFAQYALDGSDRMVRLITDLLDVSRMSAGRFIIQPNTADINEIVASEVKQLQSHAEAKGITLSLVAPPAPLPPVTLDENKTRQVIMNFIDNAIYYTEKGSVTVILSIKGGNFRVEVRDTGMGVPADAQKHLFSKFFRANNAQKSRPDGTGLGLFLAKRVIEDQGGTVIFSSTEGKGSIFGFEMPLVKPTIKTKPKVRA